MPPGITCRACRGVTEVTKTLRRPGGVIVRYRRCRACGARLVTEERPKPAASPAPVSK